jgi:hypothetical protein
MQKYLLKCRRDVLEASLDIALKQKGIKEKTGHNDGIEVEGYLASVGLPKGNQYCVAGQYWCFNEAIKTLGLEKTDNPLPKTALAKGLLNYAKQHGEAIDAPPQIHDLIIWLQPDGVHGHCERIVRKLSAYAWQTIAFNTSNGQTGNQREGDGVFLRVRNLEQNLGTMIVKCLISFTEVNNETN